MINVKKRILIFEDNPGTDGIRGYLSCIKSLDEETKNDGIELEPIPCETPAEFDAQLGRLGPRETIHLALIDHMYVNKWGKGAGGESVSEGASREVGLELVRKLVDRGNVDRIVVISGMSRDFLEKTFGGLVHECWNKNDLPFDKGFKQELEVLLDLPSRWSLTRFEADFKVPPYSNMQPVAEREQFTIPAITTDLEKRFVGKSLHARRVRAMALEAATLNVPVLITGKTGCGKEVVADIIHDYSEYGRVRRKENLPAVNCAQYVGDPQALRSELFGVAEKAFTEVSGKKGKLETSERTNFFLDEVGLAPLNLQNALLRAIEKREASRYGSTSLKDFDIKLRFIAATDVNVFGSHHFSKAFLHRLAGFCIHIPSLSERREDIPLLAEHFFTISRLGARSNMQIRLSGAALNRMLEYAWPGNVRQLRHVCEVLFSRMQRRHRSGSHPVTASIQDVDPLLPEEPESPVSAADSSGDGFDSGSDLGYTEAIDDFKARFVAARHKAISGGERTVAAYRRTAEAIGCSVSTIKELLKLAERGR